MKGICFVSLLGGMVVGASLALLISPKCGSELRHSIRHYINREVAQAKCKCAEGEECVCDDEGECHCEKVN